MSSLVYYKFKSSLNYDTIQFDGSSISVRDLRNNIRVKCNLRSNDYDLKLQDSSGREFSKEDEQIPKYRSIIVRRVPKVNSEPSRKKIANPEDMTKKDVYLNQSGLSNIPYHQLAKSSNLANSNLSEEEKIKIMMKNSSDQYTEDNYLVKPKPFGAPPLSYICRKCSTSGHWIHNCPGIRDAAGRQVDIKNVKRPTGIPNDLLLEVDAGTPGAYLSKTGNYVVPIKDAEAYALGKKEKRPFSKEENPPYIAVDDRPPENLNCPLCKNLLKDAVLVSCCSATYCNDCIMNYVFNSDEGANVCPNCHSKISDNEKDILENAIIRQMVHEWKNGNKNIAAIPTGSAASTTSVVPLKEELTKEEKVFVNNRRVLVPKGGSQSEQPSNQNEPFKKETTPIVEEPVEPSSITITETIKDEQVEEVSENTSVNVGDVSSGDCDSPIKTNEDNEDDKVELAVIQNEESIVDAVPEGPILELKCESNDNILSEVEEQTESNEKENSPSIAEDDKSPAVSCKDDQQSDSSESALDSELEKSDDESNLRRLPERTSAESAVNKAIRIKSPTIESPIKTLTNKPIRHSASSGNLTVLQSSNVDKVRPRYSNQKDHDSKSIKPNMVQNSVPAVAYSGFPNAGYYPQHMLPVGNALFPTSVVPTIPPPVHPYLSDGANPAYPAPQYPPPSAACPTLPPVNTAPWASTSGYNMPPVTTSGPYLPPPPGQLLSEDQFYQLKAKLLDQKTRRSRSPSRHSPPRRKKLSFPKSKKIKKMSPHRRPSFSPPSRHISRSPSRSGSPPRKEIRRKPKVLKPRRETQPDRYSRSKSPPNGGSRVNSPGDSRSSPPVSRYNRNKILKDDRKPFYNKKRLSRSPAERSPRDLPMTDSRDVRDRHYSRKRKYSPQRDEVNTEGYVDPLMFYKYMAQFSNKVSPLQLYSKHYADMMKQLDSRTLQSLTYGNLKSYASAYNRDGKSYYKQNYDEYSPQDYDHRYQATSRDSSPPLAKYSRNKKYDSSGQNTPVKKAKILPDNFKAKKHRDYKPYRSKESSASPKVRGSPGDEYSRSASPIVEEYVPKDQASKSSKSRPKSQLNLKKSLSPESNGDFQNLSSDSETTRSRTKKHKVTGEMKDRNEKVKIRSPSPVVKKERDIKASKKPYKTKERNPPVADDVESISEVKKRKTVKKNVKTQLKMATEDEYPPKRSRKEKEGHHHHQNKSDYKRSTPSRSSNYSEKDNIDSDNQSYEEESAGRQLVERQESRLSQKYNHLEIYAGSDNEFQDEWEVDDDTPTRPVSMVARVVSPRRERTNVEADEENADDSPKKRKKHKKDSKKKKKHRKHKKHKSSKASDDLE